MPPSPHGNCCFHVHFCLLQGKLLLLLLLQKVNKHACGLGVRGWWDERKKSLVVVLGEGVAKLVTVRGESYVSVWLCLVTAVISVLG